MPKRTSSIGLVGLFLVLLAGCAGVTESTTFATVGTSLASPTAEGTDSRTPHDLDSLPTIGETVEIPGQGFTVTVLDFARWNILPVLDSNCADPGERFVTVRIRLELVEGVSDSVQTGFWVLTDEANSEAGLAISQHPCGFDEREWPVPSLTGTSDVVDPSAPVAEGWMVFPISEDAIAAGELVVGVGAGDTHFFRLGHLD